MVTRFLLPLLRHGATFVSELSADGVHPDFLPSAQHSTIKTTGLTLPLILICQMRIWCGLVILKPSNFVTCFVSHGWIVVSYIPDSFFATAMLIIWQLFDNVPHGTFRSEKSPNMPRHPWDYRIHANGIHDIRSE